MTVMHRVEAGTQARAGGHAVEVTRVVGEGAMAKVWFRRLDGKEFTYGLRETWRYASEFAPLLTGVRT